MHVVTDEIAIEALGQMAAAMFGNLVKAVVDVDLGVMAVDVEMHSDAEALLLDAGSEQRSLWGINLHPGSFGTQEFIEYDSMINIRPSQGNNSRFVEDDDVRAQVTTLVARLVRP